MTKRGRSRPGAPTFADFEGLRRALRELPDGLVRVGDAASESDLSEAEARLGRALPADFRAFLESFDGAELFNESVRLAGVGPDADLKVVDLNQRPRQAPVRDDDFLFAETATGDVLVLAAAREGQQAVVRILPDSEERWLSGSAFSPWLEGLLAAEQLLYDSDGEFNPDAFEPGGDELTPLMAVRQAERALRRDPGAAERHHDLGIARRRSQQPSEAALAFARAAELDPENPWPWFDLGRTHLALDQAPAAAIALSHAVDAAKPLEKPRLLAWKAYAHHLGGARAEAQEAAALACHLDPALPDRLRAAAAEDDADDESQALLSVFDPAIPLRHRLAIAPDGPTKTRTPR